METIIITTKKDIEEIVQAAVMVILVAQQKKEPEKIYTINKAAKLLGCAHATLKNKINQGIISALPDGRITESEINNYLTNIK